MIRFSFTVICRCILVCSIFLFGACSSKTETQRIDFLDGDAEISIDGDSEEDTTDTESYEIEAPALPVFTNWDCPTDWTSVPGFVDENGVENVPEGMEQFTVCKPPASWSGPSGPVKLKSWVCPIGWVSVQHEDLLDENGAPFSWCGPPKVARLFVPGGNEDGSDYLTPLSDDASSDDYEICDLSKGMMPEIWGTSCVHIGDACPAGDFPEIPSSATGNRFYVKAGVVSGDGSSAAPFGTIREALNAASSGDVIVIGPGTYAEQVWPTKDITLWGSCEEKVTITAAGAYEDVNIPVVKVTRRVELRNLRISGDRPGVLVYDQTGQLVLKGVAIDRVRALGLFVAALYSPGRAEIENTLIFGVRSDPNQQGGQGSLVGRGASLKASHILAERNRTVGISASSEGTKLELSDIVIRNTQAQESDLTGGHGIQVDMIAYLTASRTLLVQNRGVGILADNTGTSLTLADTVVSDTKGLESDGSAGEGIQVTNGAGLDASRTLVERSHGAGIYASDPGTKLALTDLIIQDTQGQEGDHAGGFGITIVAAGTLEATRVLLERNRDNAISAIDAETKLTMTDLIVRNTLPQESDGMQGWGMTIALGAHLKASRLLIDNNQVKGIHAETQGTELQLSDVVVRNTQSTAVSRLFGLGIILLDGAYLDAARIWVENNRAIGIWGEGLGTQLTLADTIVSNTQVEEADGLFGLGLQASDGASLNAIRTLVEKNHETGIFAAFKGSKATLVDTVIRNTQAQSNKIGGRGLYVQDEVSVDASRILVDRNRDAGIFLVGEKAQLTLTDSIVRDTLECESDGAFGRAVGVQESAHLAATRMLLERNKEIGIFAGNAGTELTLADLIVRDTKVQKSDGKFGRGIGIQEGAKLLLERAMVARNREVGIFAISEGTSLSLTDTEIFNTLPIECRTSGSTTENCTYVAGNPLGAGIGLGIFGSATVTGQNVWVHGNESLSGVRLSRMPYAPVDLGLSDNENDWPSEYNDLKVAGTVAIRGLRIEYNYFGVHLLDLSNGYDFFASNPDFYVGDSTVTNISTSRGSTDILLSPAQGSVSF